MDLAQVSRIGRLALGRGARDIVVREGARTELDHQELAAAA